MIIINNNKFLSLVKISYNSRFYWNVINIDEKLIICLINKYKYIIKITIIIIILNDLNDIFVNLLFK